MIDEVLYWMVFDAKKQAHVWMGAVFANGIQVSDVQSRFPIPATQEALEEFKTSIADRTSSDCIWERMK